MESKGTQTLDRALDIIELLSLEREGMGVTEIGSRLDLHKSTVHRLLTALAHRGYAERDERKGSYRLGLKVVEIGSLRLRHLELKTEAAPHLRRLAEITGQPVHLGILQGTEVIYIEKIEPVASIRMYSQIGRRVPVYCSSLGKVLVSGLDAAELHRLSHGLEYKRFTPSTKIDAEVFEREIDQVRAQGWALDDEEHEAGIRCIGAPVRDYTSRVIAAISVSGDKNVISPERDAAVASTVKDIANLISSRMGFVLRGEAPQQ